MDTQAVVQWLVQNNQKLRAENARLTRLLDDALEEKQKSTWERPSRADMYESAAPSKKPSKYSSSMYDMSGYGGQDIEKWLQQ